MYKETRILKYTKKCVRKCTKKNATLKTGEYSDYERKKHDTPRNLSKKTTNYGSTHSLHMPKIYRSKDFPKYGGKCHPRGKNTENWRFEAHFLSLYFFFQRVNFSPHDNAAAALSPCQNLPRRPPPTRAHPACWKRSDSRQPPLIFAQRQ